MNIRIPQKNKIMNTIILMIISIIWLVPIAMVIMNVFKTKIEFNLGNLWLPPKDLKNISENIKLCIDNKIFISFGSSLLYCGVGTIVGVFLAMLAGFGLTHTTIRHKVFWFLVIYSGTIFPFEIYLIPIFRMYKFTGLYNTRFGMMIFWCALIIPFAMFVFRNFFLGIDNEICESAKMDGANNFQILFYILAPMAKAPIAILLLQQFSASWNDLMFGLTFTKSAEIRPVMVTLSLMGTQNPPARFLGCIIVSVPTMILFFVLRNQLEAGFSYSVK